MSFIGHFFGKLRFKLSCSFHRAKIQWIVINHQVSDKILSAENFGKQILQKILAPLVGVFDKLTKMQNSTTKISASLQQKGSESIDMLSKGYHSLNLKLASFSFFVDEWIRSISGLQERLARFSVSFHQEGKESFGSVSRGYHSLNRKLADLSIFVENWIRSISGMQGRVAKFSVQENGRESISKLLKGYETLNKKLADFAILVEEQIRKLFGFI